MIATFLMAAALSPVPAHIASLRVTVTGLRSPHGMIRLCMTRDHKHFPDCSGDPAAITRTVPGSAPVLDIDDVPPGHYAISILHDENSNGKLDKSLGIPREGFGFSHNPKIRFGPPRFQDVVIAIVTGRSQETIKLKYLL